MPRRALCEAPFFRMMPANSPPSTLVAALALALALASLPGGCSGQETPAPPPPAPAPTTAPAAPAPGFATGEWVEKFSAPIGSWYQRTLQLYGNPAAMSDDGAVVAVGCQTSSVAWETRIFREGTPSLGDFGLEATIPSSGFSVALSAGGGRAALSDVYANSMRGALLRSLPRSAAG